MAPYTVELLLNVILLVLDASDETAGGIEARDVLSVKISVWGPPTVPTINVPVPPEADISTPPRTPVGLIVVGPDPAADCLYADAAVSQDALAAASTTTNNIGLIS